MLLSEKLRKARQIKGVSLDEACKVAKISRAYLHQLENNKALRPKLQVLEDLAHYYGLNEDDLIISASKIPRDVYWKIVNNPQIITAIREFSVIG